MQQAEIIARKPKSTLAESFPTPLNQNHTIMKKSRSNPNPISIADGKPQLTDASIEERIRQRAYELWELSGRIHGRDRGTLAPG